MQERREDVGPALYAHKVTVDRAYGGQDWDRIPSLLTACSRYQPTLAGTAPNSHQ